MDYLDPKKEVKQNIMLMVGYLLLAIAISMTSILLLYRAQGFDLDRNGDVTHSSLTFFSSQPNPASIYIDGKLQKEKTNARMDLPEGTYKIKLTRDGYKAWERSVQIEGGQVERFDYPLLIPEKLVTKKVDSFAAAPVLATQSLDRRWLLVNSGPSATEFKLYDLKSKPLKSAEPVALPAALMQDNGASNSWQLVEWADNNQHVLLKHIYETNKVEYILVNRTKPAESVNLSKTLGVTTGELTLKNRKYDQYFLYDSSTGTLQSGSLKEPIRPLLLNVLAFKSYGNDTILYATNNGRAENKVQIRLDEGKKSNLLKEFTPGSTFLLDLTTYSDSLYVAVTFVAQSRTYIYKDPLDQLKSGSNVSLVPLQVLHVDNPNRLSFSNSTQFISVSNGQKIAVFDIENRRGYHYEATQPMDAPQTYATWMDGNRLTYVSNGKQIIFDYDYANLRELSGNLPGNLPMFSQAYDFVYNLTPSATQPGQVDLNQTALLTPEDQ